MNSRSPVHVVLGAGPTGRGVAESLHAAGRRVRVVTRSGGAAFPDGIESVAADVTRSEDARRACAGAGVVFGCLGLEGYRGWVERWPALMSGMLEGATYASAPFVFMDNLYMYGPVDGPMHEDLPLTDHGVKPALRARLTRTWQEAHASGRVRVVAVRASDFYGPGVTKALLGDYVTGRVVEGKTARVLGKPEHPHAFAYMPDVVRALIDIGDAAVAEATGAGPTVCGQAWHAPHAPARPVRRIVETIHRTAGRPTKMQVAGSWMVKLFGLFDAEAREIDELMFQWTRPYLVDDTRFRTRFGWEATPLDDGIPRTVEWFQARLR